MQTEKITLITIKKENHTMRNLKLTWKSAHNGRLSSKWEIMNAMRCQNQTEDLRSDDIKRETINATGGDLSDKRESIRWTKISIATAVVTTIINVVVTVISSMVADCVCVPPHTHIHAPHSVERVAPEPLKCPILEEPPAPNPIPHKERENNSHPDSERDMHHNPPMAYAKGGFGVSMGGESENQA